MRHLKKGSSHLFYERQEVKYHFILQNKGVYRPEKMCKTFNISTNGYYTWLSSKKTTITSADFL